ncbi:hypothetical protein [Emticicia sp. BO119]|uniref:hypothetical protein n=1 Tax=Emticicia sp. BO119 TaxID=2757768 RepID=UPI0015F04B05|nr:hypothetical protein [Emticicia sp. BO119]MBA4851367.1 hypothetical protein [Emticicia sp. BO119]
MESNQPNVHAEQAIGKIRFKGYLKSFYSVILISGLGFGSLAITNGGSKPLVGMVNRIANKEAFSTIQKSSLKEEIYVLTNSCSEELKYTISLSNVSTSVSLNSPKLLVGAEKVIYTTTKAEDPNNILVSKDARRYFNLSLNNYFSANRDQLKIIIFYSNGSVKAFGQLKRRN